MRVAIRVDASVQMGTGHVARCATLASALRDVGVEVSFLCRDLPGNRISWIERQGFEVRTLRAPDPAEEISARMGESDLLGVPPERDIEESRQALAAHGRPDWLVVDHYALGANWESAMRSNCARIMVIDDLADRRHDCDLLLDQNLVADIHARYQGLVPPSCRLALGPSYALLNSDYAEFQPRARVRSGPVRRLLVFFGGGDAENLTGRALVALKQSRREDLKIDVVVGGANPHLENLSRLAIEVRGTTLHVDLPSLAPLMLQADLALGAGGVTTWERCCLGLPAVVITLAANQVPIARELDARGAVVWFGDAATLDQETLTARLAEILSHDLEDQWSRYCRELVDGQGCSRIVAAMLAGRAMEIHLRDARATDEARLLTWANDPIVRENGFSRDCIDPAGHHSWFAARFADRANCRIYIAETSAGVPVGQVRLEYRDGAWLVGYSLDACFRGVGLGDRLLGGAIEEHVSRVGAGTFVGRVKQENHASCRVFASMGFSARDAEHGVIEYTLPATCSANFSANQTSRPQPSGIAEVS